MLLIVCTWHAVALNYNLNRHAEYVRQLIIIYLQEIKNIKNVKRCRDGMPKSIQTR